MTVCFELNVFQKNLMNTSKSTSNSRLRNVVGCHQNRNSSQTFCGDNLIFKNLKKLCLLESLFNQNTKFEITATKTLENPEVFVVEFPFNEMTRLHSKNY